MIIIRLLTRVGLLILWPFIMVYRGIWWTLKKIGAGFAFIGRGIWWVIRKIGSGFAATGRAIWATPMAIIRTPMRMYRRTVVWRDWLIHKVEYLQSESKKWSTTFAIVRSPYSALRMMGLSPQLAVGLLFAGSAAGTTVAVNEALKPPSFSAGDAGTYQATGIAGHQLDVPTHYSSDDNTLKILMGTTVPIGEIVIEDIHIGLTVPNGTIPSGQSHVIQIGGATSTSAWLEVGDLLIDRWRCDRFEMKNVNVHTLKVLRNFSDGQSISASPGAPRARAVGGGNRAESANTRGGFYDQLRIENAGATGGMIDQLVLRNLYTRGAGCILRNINASTITIQDSMFGVGNSLALKEFVIATSTIYKIFINEENTEGVVPVAP